MASVEHIALSDFIKSVHQNLRDTSKKLGPVKAWKEHCGDTENLKKYAEAMQKLACQFWEENNDSQANSRIQWTINSCVTYFTKDIDKFRGKEEDICRKINSTLILSDLYDIKNIGKLKLLDVGSCYNPFSNFEVFEVTAIDIAPATDEVVKCDFLRVGVGETMIINNKELLELPKNHFDIVVFSLLLEYLPSPTQRLTSCKKAYDLLKKEGLLVVITPDSNHIGINAKYMKSWRFILAEMGFSRIKYEKLKHVHCMAFRKSANKAVARRWTEVHGNEQMFAEMYIPQDFKLCDEHEPVLCKSKKDPSDTVKNCIDFSELPNCDIFQ